MRTDRFAGGQRLERRRHRGIDDAHRYWGVGWQLIGWPVSESCEVEEEARFHSRLRHRRRFRLRERHSRAHDRQHDEKPPATETDVEQRQAEAKRAGSVPFQLWLETTRSVARPGGAPCKSKKPCPPHARPRPPALGSLRDRYGSTKSVTCEECRTMIRTPLMKKLSRRRIAIGAMCGAAIGVSASLAARTQGTQPSNQQFRAGVELVALDF